MSALAALVLAVAPAASAGDNWLPHPTDATWTYQWTDSTYETTPTTEQVTVKSSKGTSFTLAWTTDGLNNPADAVSTTGTVEFQGSNSGLVNTNWSSTPPPADWPVLCASAASCGNALAGTYYNVIWGSRNPVLQEPLVQGLTWTSTGGAGNDVASTSTYLGQAPVTVPAFPQPVMAARVRSTISQAGALGDPYGSGTRTIWWVYGVGPVKIVFEHAGGSHAPVTTIALQSTNQQPQPPPTDLDYFPFKKGQTLTYRWTNTKYLKKPEVQQVTVDAVVNGSARFTVKDVSGPIKVAGTYGFSKRLDGVTNLWGNTQSATVLKFPPLGPSFAAPTNRRHIVTPFGPADVRLQPGPTRISGGRRHVVGRTAESRLHHLRSHGQLARARGANSEGAGGKLPRAGSRLDTEREGVPLRQRNAGGMVRAGQGTGQARLQARRRQRLDRRAAQVGR